MPTKSKAYRAAAEKIEEGKFYSPSEAVEVARETGSKKFNSTVEVALKPVPVTVRVKSAEPAWTAFGLMAETEGTAPYRPPVAVVLTFAWLFVTVGS